MPQWTWARASCRGLSHIVQGTRRQDALSCLAANAQTLIAIVSDGAGSTSHGGEGASIATRIFARSAVHHMRNSPTLPDDEMIWTWIDDIRDQLARASLLRSVERKNFAATLVGVISTADKSLIIHIGDGAVVGRNKETGIWEALSWPEHGEYASTTFFITDDPKVRLRISRSERCIDGLAVFSDGIERIALSFAERVPHAPFFNGIFKPVEQSTASGCDLGLSHKLVSYLASAAINERTDDDKSLIIAAFK
jgi:Protein phosphatase 2C